jgi:hypothetical protein
MRDRAARCVLGIPQKRPQPCIHAALRTIARFHPVQQTRIQTAPRTVGERSQLFRRRRPAALLTEWRFSKFHPSASQQRARPIDKISTQDETVRGGGVAFEIQRRSRRRVYCRPKAVIHVREQRNVPAKSGRCRALVAPRIQNPDGLELSRTCHRVRAEHGA